MIDIPHSSQDNRELNGGIPMLPLAVTLGEPAGIGPEITLMAWLARGCEDVPPFVVYGDPELLASRARHVGFNVPIKLVHDALESVSAFGDALPVIPVPLAVASRARHADSANGPAVIAAIEHAVAAVVQGAAAAIVTNPIAKHVLYETGFAYPGHTEFLSDLAEQHHPGRRFRSVMLLACAELRVVPLTIHIPLNRVPEAISNELITETAMTLHTALQADFDITAPCIAVAGLNPHAGESGTLGREEMEIIGPAIAALAAKGVVVSGPHSADTLFHAAARQTYDAVIAMYHDQALIPIKTLAFDRGVNVTLGLPFVRTSPDHGTAFDIAGTGKASATSLIEAMKLAARMANARARVS